MFVLYIPATLSAVERIKGELTKALPEVKSSHRVEAIGRGFGFRTYAALLAAARSPNVPDRLVEGSLFSEYLAQHGFSVDPAHFYRAAARVAIRAVLDAVARLQIFGVGFPRPDRNPDGSWQTPQQCYAAFVEHREECLGTHAAEAFLRSLAFLSRVEKTKTIRPTNSYRLKHIAENYVCSYPEGGELGSDYVPNGMLIAAAIHLGFKYKCHIDHLGYDALNVSFNMSTSCIDDLDAEIRSWTRFAQDRARKRQHAA